MPQYMLLIYTPVDGPPAGTDPEQTSRWYEYTQSLMEAGVHVGGDALQGVDSATTVRVRDGETQIIDGPFAETKEFLAGYYLLECPDLDTALEHASRMPNIHYGSTEVRPVLDLSEAMAEAAQAHAEQ
ncbi:MAG TPA: YciI family protein [Thermoleophilaceae bacterium]|jgi:hypothetical protein